MPPKVSIIVPVYKVEKYLHRCVESLITQTYGDIEIILVNDGSPDECGKIIEEYKIRDHRVKAVHKENGGLSDARNEGMHYATGDYIYYVDSDDWVPEDSIKILVHALEFYKADIVQAAFYYSYDDYLLYDNRYFMKNHSPIILDNEELMSELVKNEVVKNFAWGKLYRRKVLEGLLFKKGVLFEDVFWAHLVMQRVHTYVIIHEPLYYYQQRNDSIVSTFSSRNLDLLTGLIERHEFIKRNYPGLIDESYRHILKVCFSYYLIILRNWKINKTGNDTSNIEQFIKKHYQHLKKAVKKDKYLMYQLKFFRIHPLFMIIYLGLAKVLRKIRLLPEQNHLQRIEKAKG